MKIYISNDSTHCILSYILLDNCDKNQVAIFFEANPDLKRQCEIISKELAHSQVKAFYRGSVELNENLVLALLHACLPNNSILEEIDYLLRLVISSVLSNIVDKDIDEYDEVILKLILMLPLIKERIGKINTIDEKIIKNIENIENSKELKQLVNKSYQYIEQCFEEDLSLAQFNSFVMYTCVLCTYYDKMSESTVIDAQRENHPVEAVKAEHIAFKTGYPLFSVGSPHQPRNIIEQAVPADTCVHQRAPAAVGVGQALLQRLHPAVHGRYAVPEGCDDLRRLAGEHINLIHPGNGFIEVVLLLIALPANRGKLLVPGVIARVDNGGLLGHIAVHDL